MSHSQPLFEQTDENFRLGAEADTLVFAEDDAIFDTTHEYVESLQNDEADMSYDEETEGYLPRVRDIKKNYRRGYGMQPSSRGNKPETVVNVFIRRTAQVLQVSEGQVSEILVNKPSRAVRVNSLQFGDNSDINSQVAELDGALSVAEVSAYPLPWYKSARIFGSSDTPTVQSMPITESGKAYIQNPSSFLPVLALDPTPQSRILDMCSAPGGKAALIAARAEGIDLTVNEPKGRRMQRLKEVLNLLGVERATFSMQDGRHLPNLIGKETFDQILIDAECSTEAGINFESSNPLAGWSTQRVEKMSMLQKQLIVAGFDLLMPGGVLVYSTCTLSPEENEGVVTALLDRRPGATIQPLTFDAEPNSRKIRSWQGKKYPSEVSDGALRIFPGDYMEGFFVARIRKPSGDSALDATANEPVSLDDIAQRTQPSA